MSGYSLDDLIAAEMAGRAYPDPALVERLAEIRLNELIHERTCEMLSLARQSASAKGPNWRQMVEEQAAQDWEGQW